MLNLLMPIRTSITLSPFLNFMILGVAVQPVGGGQDMGLDQRMERPQDHGAGADSVGQPRDAEINALPSMALALRPTKAKQLAAQRTAVTYRVLTPPCESDYSVN